MRKLETWILLMDGLKAKILKRETSGDFVHIYGTEHIEEFYHQANIANHQFGSPRQHGGAPGVHHVFPHEENPKEIDKQNFVKKIAHFLTENRAVYDKVVLVAPDRILGYLRTSFHKEVTEKIVQEIKKDLMKIPLNKLGSHFS